jgi:hypothetical protein
VVTAPAARHDLTCPDRRPSAIRTRDLLLRRSFQAGGQAAAFLVGAGSLIVSLRLSVSSFRSVLAREWHGDACRVLLLTDDLALKWQSSAMRLII